MRLSRFHSRWARPGASGDIGVRALSKLADACRPNEMCWNAGKFGIEPRRPRNRNMMMASLGAAFLGKAVASDSTAWDDRACGLIAPRSVVSMAPQIEPCHV